MKNIDKNSLLNKENNQNDNTLLYVLLLIAFAVLVGGLVWWFFQSRNKTPQWNHDYEAVLGKKKTTPSTAEEVSKLVAENRDRIKTAKRVLAGEIKGRTLTKEQKKEVESELKNVREDVIDFFRGKDLKSLEKNDPESLANIYSLLYEQGEVSVRLKDKTSVFRSPEELKRHEKLQSEWSEQGITEEEEVEIKKVMDEWITKWYNQARAELIGLEPGKYPLLVDGALMTWKDEKKLAEPIKLKKPYTYDGKNKVEKTTDFSPPLDVKFKGYYGFLTEEDKKGSSEGTETFGLTKSEGAMLIYTKGGKLDKETHEPVEPVPKDFFLIKLFEDNRREIKIGLEKKMFFNRLGHEEWLSEVKYEGQVTSRIYHNICFEEVLETIVHELAHAIVNTIKFRYEGEEGGGHGEFFYEVMQKIEKMVKASPDFPEFKTWWEKPEKEQKQWSRESILDKQNHWDQYKYWYLGGGFLAISVGGLTIILLWDGGRSSSKKHAKN